MLWTRPLGRGYSGFTAADDRIYTQYQSLGGQYVICLDAATGETVWEYRYDHPYDPAGLYPGPRGTPTLAQGRVYFAGPSSLVGCLSAETGRHVWSVNVFERFAVEPVEFGYSCSPTVVGQRVLLPVGRPGATMVALDAATGRTLWHSGDEPISHVPAFPIEFQGRPLVIGYLRNAIAAYELETGQRVWLKRRAAGYDERAAWPIYAEPHLWFSGPFRWGSELIELVDDTPGFRPVWKSSILSNDVCSSVLVDGHLYGFDIRDAQSKAHRPSRGQFRCIDFLTGQQQWATGTPGRREQRASGQTDPSSQETSSAIGQASVLYADGKLILLNDTGELILARANPERYEELGRVGVLGGEICWTQPTLLGGRLFLRNQSRAACLVLSPAGQPTDGGPTLTVADIPQTTYRDWAAILLAVEPKYAMDLPTLELLRRWFYVTLALWAIAAVVAELLAAAGRSIGLASSSTGCGLHALLALVFGALGTTLLSGWTGQFLFTWPLCLFVTLQATLAHAQPSRRSQVEHVWRGRIVLFGFILLSLAYFFVCRRLSLAFEWTFLVGYAAAVPALLLAQRQTLREPWRRLGELVLSAAAYAAYYWASVGVLLWKY